MVTYGEEVWPCACGCGGELRERIYLDRLGRLVRRSRPTWLAGHDMNDPAKRAKLNAAIRKSTNRVPRAPIVKVVMAYKMRHGLTWRQVNKLLGYSIPQKGSGPASRLVTNVCPTMERWLAERILRRLVGLSTAPTEHERRLAS